MGCIKRTFELTSDAMTDVGKHVTSNIAYAHFLTGPKDLQFDVISHICWTKHHFQMVLQMVWQYMYINSNIALTDDNLMLLLWSEELGTVYLLLGCCGHRIEPVLHRLARHRVDRRWQALAAQQLVVGIGWSGSCRGNNRHINNYGFKLVLLHWTKENLVWHCEI